jgi:hypothetical protein
MSDEKTGTSLKFLDNFNPTEPASKLIDKVSSAIGVLYEPTRIKREAKANAEAKKIAKLSDIELSDIEQRAINRMLTDETKKQQNIESITTQAIEHLADTAMPEELDEDWISNFFDKCKNITDADMQTLWSKILSEESNKSNSFSKRTVEAAALLDKREADMFTKLCRFIGTTTEPYIFLFGGNHPYVTKAGLNFNRLVELEAAGLIKFNTDSGFAMKTNPDNAAKVILGYFGKTILLDVPPQNRGVPYGSVMLTNVGKQLSKICASEALPGFAGYLSDIYSSERIKVTEM